MTSDCRSLLEEMGKKAKKAAVQLMTAGSKKDETLKAMAQALLSPEGREKILAANRLDLDLAEKAGMRPSLLDRLALSPARLDSMAKGILDVAAWPDPVGKLLDGSTLPNGLRVRRVTVPLGVVGMIFEARPNVTSDAAALCLKAGNPVILRGGKEAYHSNRAIADLLSQGAEQAGLDGNSIQLVDDTSRQSAVALMELTDYLDVLIPRGGAGLIRSVKENSRVPVIETGVGNCHVYVDKSADLSMACEIIYNAKTSRPSVCNAIETVLIHEAVAQDFLPEMARRLAEKKVELRGCERTQKIIPCVPATEEDWKTEFLDYILAVRVVDSLEEAIAHIAAYSTHHSDCIVTRDLEAAQRFTQQVDSAAVYVNASTRFTDGGEMGLGAEIGISTQKLHARGPMGLNQLVSYKYIIEGEGQIR